MRIFRSCSSRLPSLIRLSRWRSSRRRSRTRKRWRSRCNDCRRKIPPSRFTRTKTPARRSSPEWANCIWRSFATACCASSKWTRNAGKPQIAYRETITAPADGEGKLIKQSGGRGQYGHVIIKTQPNERGKGITIENKVVGGNIPKEYIPACKKGHRRSDAQRRGRRLPGDRRHTSTSSTAHITTSTRTKWRSSWRRFSR